MSIVCKPDLYISSPVWWKQVAQCSDTCFLEADTLLPVIIPLLQSKASESAAFGTVLGQPMISTITRTSTQPSYIFKFADYAIQQDFTSISRLQNQRKMNYSAYRPLGL